MSFLDELKAKASALQVQQVQQLHGIEENCRLTEAACQTAWTYLQDLARQLNVLAPSGPSLTLDNKNAWPAMAMRDFRTDARKKRLRDKEVFDYMAMGWQLLPKLGEPIAATVSVNFLPDLKRIESRLRNGGVKHERKDIRHPEKNTLLAYSFDYLTEARGYVHITPDHDRAVLAFRLSNLNGFEVHNCEWPAAKVNGDLLDELAKLLVQQPSRFM